MRNGMGGVSAAPEPEWLAVTEPKFKHLYKSESLHGRTGLWCFWHWHSSLYNQCKFKHPSLQHLKVSVPFYHASLPNFSSVSHLAYFSSRKHTAQLCLCLKSFSTASKSTTKWTYVIHTLGTGLCVIQYTRRDASLCHTSLLWSCDARLLFKNTHRRDFLPALFGSMNNHVEGS